MKKLILLLALSAGSLFGAPHIHEKDSYKNVPERMYAEVAKLQSTLIHASWCSKYVVYNFDSLHFNNVILFFSYNDDCTFTLQFNKTTHDCEVEFIAHDDSFNYDNFKAIMDAFLLYD